MRLWSVLSGGRSRSRVPINIDDHDETGMDDLMRMAMGHYPDDEDEEGNLETYPALQRSRETPRTLPEPGVDHEQPVFCQPHPTLWSSGIGHANGSMSALGENHCSTEPEVDNVSDLSALENCIDEGGLGRPQCCTKPKVWRSFCARHFSSLKFPKRRWCLVLLSVFVSLMFIGVNVGLGVYSLVFYNPDQLVIDKSVKSFSIPNHKAYCNFEAFMLARRDNSTSGRYRRHNSETSSVDKLSFDLHKKRSKRNALLTKEDEMLKHTASVLHDLNRKNTGFTHKSHNVHGLPPYIFKSDQTDSIKGSVESTLERLPVRHKRSNRQIECLFDYQSIVRWKMHVIYLAQGDEELNMFTKERLQTAHNIEQQIIQHPDFHHFCLRDSHLENYDPAVRDLKGCVPLNSLLTYFFPSVDNRGNIYYDGLGTNIDDIDSALKLAMNQETFYYYVDDKINKTFQKSYMLRSEVLFGAPLAGFSCIGGRKDQDKKFKDFVVTYIDLLSKASTEKVQVLYGGNEIFDYEVSTTFWGDVHLAMVSLVAIFVLMLVLSLSLYLTVLGVIVIALSFPMSLFFYRVVFGINALGILNGAAAFVIIGIGVDDVFVFVNIYRQAWQMKNPACRVKHTLRTAGVATFFTSFTTAAAFAANLTSAIPAVYEFGLFMSLVVSSCWLSVIILMPPMLYLHACFFEPLEKMFSRCCGQTGEENASADDTGEGSSASTFLSLQYQRQQEALGRGLYPDDGDVPMLDIGEEQELSYDGMDDDNMLIMDDPNRDNNYAGPLRGVLALGEDWSQDALSHDADIAPGVTFDIVDATNNNNNMCLGRIIQRCVMFMTNRIIIPGRFFIVAFYAIVLVVSCLLISRLQPSTHPPQLFRPDTNIQQLLDLKANFSIIDTLHCDRCSGLYKVPMSQARKADATNPPLRAAASKLSPPPFPPPPPIPMHNMSTTTIDTLNNQSVGGKSGHDSSSDPSSTKVSSSESQQSWHKFNISKDTTHSGEDPDYIDGVTSGVVPEASSDKSVAAVSGHSDSKTLTFLGSALSQIISLFGSSDDSDQVDTSSSPTQISGLDTAHLLQSDIASKGGSGPNTTTAQAYIPPPPSVEAPSIKYTSPPFPIPFTDKEAAGSVDENFDVCADQSCDSLKDRPLLESGATVYVVMGISGLDRPEDDVGHVIDQFKGKAIFDPKFAESFNLNALNPARLEELCRVCHFIANQTDLVKTDSAHCLPTGMHSLFTVLNTLPACNNLPGRKSVYQYQAPAHAEAGLSKDGHLLWLAFAFESTTSEGQAYFQAYKQYEKWQKLIAEIKSDVLDPNSPLTSIFQTSEFWTKVLMEIVAVHSAIYGLVLSLLICVLAVAVFTGHLVLLLLVIVTILATICCVLGVFYLCGWEVGAVEAVSLSILVGSSVDYLVHVVEGYILAGARLSQHSLHTQSPGELRRARASLAVRHIGVAVVCSAVTTVIAAVPLTQTSIQPFAKFGSILLLNTCVSVGMTLTLAVALLAIFAPAQYRSWWRPHLLALLGAATFTGLLVLGLYILSSSFGVHIPGPTGEPLFS